MYSERHQTGRSRDPAGLALATTVALGLLVGVACAGPTASPTGERVAAAYDELHQASVAQETACRAAAAPSTTACIQACLDAIPIVNHRSELARKWDAEEQRKCRSERCPERTPERTAEQVAACSASTDAVAHAEAALQDAQAALDVPTSR